MKNWLIFSIVYFLAYNHQLCGQIIRTTTNEIALDLSNNNNNTSLPFISWEEPSGEYVNSEEDRISIVASVKSDIALKTIWLRIINAKDNEVVSELQFNDASTLNDYTISKSNIHLLDGENIVEVEAEDIKGGKVYSVRRVIVGMNALKDILAIDRKDNAILFATNIYENWNDLNNPVFDVETIARELTERYGFQVETVLNPKLDDINIKLKEYAEKEYKPQDQLFVFFAGHGMYDETFGEGYVVARNSLRNDRGKTTYMSHSNLRTYLNNIPCDHIFLAMDVCFGGTFDPLVAKRSTYEETDDLEFIVRKLSVKSRKYLTSGGKEYVPDGTPGSHSPFAKKMLEAIRSNGGEDQILTLSEITSYMERLQITPQFGNFGSDEAEKGSDFLFIVK